MALAEAMGAGEKSTILLGGKAVEYRLVPSRAARKLRVKVKADGIDVIVPEGRTGAEALAFVVANQKWVVEQNARAQTLVALRRPATQRQGRLLFLGEAVPVHVIRSEGWHAPNRVTLVDGRISITCGARGVTSPSRSLENWLRKQARARIEQHLGLIAKRIKRSPARLYVMGQRTKWGNCSALGNLSFNWRLIMAPEYVLRYLVTHEMVHLAVPDHSPKFWLTVRSLCPETERARQWLVANSHRLTVDLDAALQSSTSG